MSHFRDIKTLEKFVSAHASIFNRSSHHRHINNRDTFTQNRSADLAEWRQWAA